MLKGRLRSLAIHALSKTIVGLARLFTGVRPEWRGCQPSSCARIYAANHTSHADFVLIWAVMPSYLRENTRPVAAKDYWRGGLKKFLGEDVFRAVMIERSNPQAVAKSFFDVRALLRAGQSLILFPEGTRNASDSPLAPLKSGIYYLAKTNPRVEVVPVWIDNVSRVMPKGEFLPIPLLCAVYFGAPLCFEKDETEQAYLARLRAALLNLAPKNQTIGQDI